MLWELSIIIKNKTISWNLEVGVVLVTYLKDVRELSLLIKQCMKY